MTDKELTLVLAALLTLNDKSEGWDVRAIENAKKLIKAVD